MEDTIKKPIADKPVYHDYLKKSTVNKVKFNEKTINDHYFFLNKFLSPCSAPLTSEPAIG